MFDLVVKNGTVVDPSQSIHECKDVATLKGRISDVRKGINAAEARHVLDASGMIVAPGMIDLHVHCCDKIEHMGISPDLACLARGSTTVLDAGSTGELNYAGFRRYVIDISRTRIFSLLNIESLGMIEFAAKNQKWPKLIDGHDELFINKEGASEVIKRNSDNILGIKWAHHGIEGLRLAREVADRSGCLLMAENRHQPENLEYMKKGDIITHLFHGLRAEQHDGLLDEDGRVRSEFFEAVKRGVILDVGHGAESFVWKVAEAGLGQGIKPDTISTDLHTNSVNGPAYDMPTTMSKFLLLGMSLDEAIRASVTKPAEVLGKEDDIGTLKIGACADITIFRIIDGKFAFVDAKGDGKIGRQKITIVVVVRAGEIVR